MIIRTLARLAPAVFALALVSGCGTPSIQDPARAGPFYKPSNYHGESSLGGVRRVVVLPVYGGTLAPQETVAGFDPVFIAALQRQNRFEVVPLSREECQRRFRVAEFSSVAALPHDFLTALKRQTAADAVLFVDITVFRAYRPLALGLRGKLATIDGSRLVWTFDDVFSADNPAVANSARHHNLTTDRGDVPADLSPAVLQSPARFADYVASAMFATLPPVILPAEIPGAKSSK
ncbi:MAG: hypothetical protein NTV51_14410 [Verrucomicrobia bacterium]|nr:hypothetical protein [Verrucomicrobiota bacterium]